MRYAISFALLGLQPALADETLPEVELEVQPLLCIVDDRSPTCDARFRIAWRSAETGYYCVFTNLEDEPLRCWPHDAAGTVEDQRRAQEDFRYRLNRGASDTALATVTVEVLRMDSGDRRRNRRSRHVWDVL